jgi:hypothetical protein
VTAIARCLRAPGREKLLAAEALVVLTIAWMVIKLLPFRRVARWLGREGAEQAPAPPHGLEVADDVARAITRAVRYHPLKPVCLPQAIAGRFMLARRGIPSTLYLGVRKGDVGLEAHAWLTVASVFVTGGGNADQFTTLQWFS